MIGDLSFGESFQCLENSSYHSWISALNRMTRQGAYFVVLGNMGFEWLVTLLFKTGRLTSRNKNSDIVTEKLLRRMQIQRHDFVDALLRNTGKVGRSSSYEDLFFFGFACSIENADRNNNRISHCLWNR